MATLVNKLGLTIKHLNKRTRHSKDLSLQQYFTGLGITISILQQCVYTLMRANEQLINFCPFFATAEERGGGEITTKQHVIFACCEE